MIVVASTCAPWKCGQEGHELAWLRTWDGLAASSPEPLTAFLALEWPMDGPAARVLRERTEPLVRRLNEVQGALWRFSIDDGEPAATSGNRLHRICAGRNLATEFALRSGASACLFVDTDVEPPGDAISKLLEIDHPLVGGDVPQYGLRGPRVMCATGHVRRGECGSECAPYEFRVESHWNTAGALLVRREALRMLRWGWDPDGGCTDDPWYQARAVAAGFGQTWVRKDCRFRHVAPLIPVERRQGERRYA